MEPESFYQLPFAGKCREKSFAQTHMGSFWSSAGGLSLSGFKTGRDYKAGGNFLVWPIVSVSPWCA
jgi:hypothetical protein